MKPNKKKLNTIPLKGDKKEWWKEAIPLPPSVTVETSPPSKTKTQQEEDELTQMKLDLMMKLLQKTAYSTSPASYSTKPNKKKMASTSSGNNPNWNNYVTMAGTSGLTFSSGNTFGDEEKTDERLVLFYGFNGILAQRYSVIADMSRDEITVRMELAKNKISWKLESYRDFMKMVDMFRGTPNQLLEVPFDDAMNTIRVGLLPDKEEFEDAEVEEFTDNCVSSCKPGSHACGKK